jgi:glycosyltransferase involved in cell wall biosynthesis
MNVLVVPSWYPHRCFPREGIYVRDQAMLLGEMFPSWRIGLALWHQGRNLLTRAHALHSPRCVVDALLDRALREERLSENVVAWTIPTLVLPERLRQGNRESILRSVREAARRMTERWGRIDLIHAHVAYPGGWAAMRLSAEVGIPYVITEHMGPFPLPVYRESNGRLPSFIREPLERADACIAVSPALATEIQGHDLPPVEVVPNVVDERRYDPTRSGDPGRFTFFTLCQMVRAKGIEDLLEGAARMLGRLTQSERARVRFRIAGKGPDLPAFRGLSRRLGLGENVQWIEGYLEREESRDEFERCDAFVLPSHKESFGIVYVEAMACGKPSIATRCGGPESILDPDTGVLIEVGDVAALAGALETLFRNAGRYDRARIRATFERRFSRRAVAAALEATYARVLAREPRTRVAAP